MENEICLMKASKFPRKRVKDNQKAYEIYLNTHGEAERQKFANPRIFLKGDKKYLGWYGKLVGEDRYFILIDKKLAGLSGFTTNRWLNKKLGVLSSTKKPITRRQIEFESDDLKSVITINNKETIIRVAEVGLALQPEYQHKGFAVKILKLLCAQMTKQHVQYAYLSTQEQNKAMQIVGTKTGWERIAAIKRSNNSKKTIFFFTKIPTTFNTPLEGE